MFRCQICGQVAAPGTRATKVVVVSRAKVYAQRGGSDSNQRGRGRFRAPKKPIDQGGKGNEIVQEVTACVDCAKKQKTTIIEAPEPVEEVVESEVVETETAEVEATETATEEKPDAAAE
ncbi:MAG: hypothetical protein AB8G99_20655 [Planctomycetaceae bacterium]